MRPAPWEVPWWAWLIAFVVVIVIAFIAMTRDYNKPKDK